MARLHRECAEPPRRYNDNRGRVANGYFSVIGELAVRLRGRLEMVGLAYDGPLPHVVADATK
jgi:hypothetical protein